MNDLISRKALLAEYDRVHIGEPGKARKLIEDAPRVDAVDLPMWATERAYKNGYEQGKKDALKQCAVTREKLIELLDSKQTYGVATWESPNIITRNEKIADFLVANGVVISNLETPTMQGWKSVYDPPKRMIAVIVLYKDNTGMQVGGGYVNDFGVWTLLGNAKGIIKYWMPLTLPIPNE